MQELEQQLPPDLNLSLGNTVSSLPHSLYRLHSRGLKHKNGPVGGGGGNLCIGRRSGLGALVEGPLVYDYWMVAKDLEVFESFVFSYLMIIREGMTFLSVSGGR
jgi:hypothetical protein